MRRRSSDEQAVSLFPFLSILACVIGVLTLMITGSALSQIDEAPDQAAVERSRRYSELVARMSADQAELDRLETLLAESAERRDTLAKAREQLRALQSRHQAAQTNRGRDDDLAKQLRSEAEVLKQRIAELEAEHQRLAGEVAELAKKVEERRRPPEAVVTIQPSGTGSKLTPSFVECSDVGLVLYDGPEPKLVRASDIGGDPSFVELVRRVAKEETGILIFLLRDNGTGTYWAARNVADANYCKNGKLPVIGHGKIDLSLFQ